MITFECYTQGYLMYLLRFISIWNIHELSGSHEQHDVAASQICSAFCAGDTLCCSGVACMHRTTAALLYIYDALIVLAACVQSTGEFWCKLQAAPRTTP